MRQVLGLLSFATMVAITGCGQAPSFVDSSQGNNVQRNVSGGSGSSSSGDATASTPAGSKDSADAASSPSGSPSADSTASTGGSSASGGAASGGGASGGGAVTPAGVPAVVTPASGGSTGVIIANNPSDPSSPTFNVPGATDDEVKQIKQCIQKWGRVPFTGTFTNVRRIAASVSVGGFGNPLNDTVQTSAPALILVDAGVNVGGTPTYNLLNQNGYYCMKVNVNVRTNLNINLACNARMADTSVQVNVNSNAGSTAVVGVNVGSNVQVNPMTPAGQACGQ